jgi:sulfide:quinone oxidoreductase
MSQSAVARVVVLGAGFGGLELTTRLSAALGEAVDITLIDQAEAFVFGFSKLDVMFGHRTAAEMRSPYSAIAKPGVRFRQETIEAIDPVARRVVTDGGAYDADVLVVALGADYDVAATPGLAEIGHEFYSVPGAERLREVIASFESGHAVVGVAGTPFKCPPAPSEAALLLDDHLTRNGRRDGVDIALVMPFGAPVPPSPETSRALLATFEERGIRWVPERKVVAREPSIVVLDDGSRLPCDLFLGIPIHRVPAVVEASGMAVDGWVPVDPLTLETRFPDVYAVGDVTSVGTPKAGVFAEGAAAVVADNLIARFRGSEANETYDGRGSCYIEFGHHLVGRVDVRFLTGSPPTGTFAPPSEALTEEKRAFGSSRRARWFGP